MTAEVSTPTSGILRNPKPLLSVISSGNKNKVFKSQFDDDINFILTNEDKGETIFCVDDKSEANEQSSGDDEDKSQTKL